MPNMVFGFSEASIHWAIVFSVNIAIPWFLLAFSSRPLTQCWPNKFSRWALRNRRYLGINWGIAFLTHGIFIIIFASLYPKVFFSEADWATIRGGSVVFFVSTLMLVTSNNQSVRLLGPKLWAVVHTVGGYLLLVTLLFTLVVTNIHKPWLWPFAALTVLVVMLRVITFAIKRVKQS